MQRSFYILSLIITIGCFFLLGTETYAQKGLEKGNAYYDRNMYAEAIPYYLKELDGGSDESKQLAMEKIANCYRLTGQFAEAESWYAKVMKREKKDPINILNYGIALKSSAKYGEAAQVFAKYRDANPTDKMANVYIESCALAEKWLSEPVTYDVKLMSQFSSKEPDFGIAYLDSGLVICSSRQGSMKRFIDFSGGGDATMVDFFYADLNNPTKAPTNTTKFKGLNSYYHEGPATFTRDGNTVYFTQTVKGVRSADQTVIKNTLQVMVSERRSDGSWTKPKSAFTFNSNEYSVAHPSLSKDEQKIYFMSDMPGGFGGTDIYVSNRDRKGVWGQPLNLGDKVNTFGYELYPYAFSDSLIYFASNTHPGLGNLDIFSAAFVNKKWTNITNLKSPINSPSDDFGLVRERGTNRGFFTSDRFNGIGADDIYSFIGQKPIELSLDGAAFNIKDENLFNGITYRLENTETSEKTNIESTTGNYNFNMPLDKTYSLGMRKDGFSYNRVEMRLNRDSADYHIYLALKPTKQDISFGGYIKKLDNSLVYKEDTATSKYAQFPIANAKVRLLEEGKLVKEVETNASGKYDFGVPLKAGRNYVITAQKGKSVIITFKGIVKFKEQNLEGVVLKVNYKKEFAGRGYTDADGIAKIKLQPGKKYTVSLSKEGYSTKTVKLSTENAQFSQEIEQIIHLEENDTSIFARYLRDTTFVNKQKGPVTVIGLVKNKRQVLMGATLQLYDAKGNALDEKKSNFEGVYEFDLLPKTVYGISVKKTGYNRDSTIVSTKQFKSSGIIYRSFTLNLTKPDSLSNFKLLVKGTTFYGDSILPEVKVELYGADSSKIDNAVTGLHGNFNFKLDTNKTYALRLTKTDFYPKTVILSTKELDPELAIIQNVQMQPSRIIQRKVVVPAKINQDSINQATIAYYKTHSFPGIGTTIAKDTALAGVSIKVKFKGLTVIDTISSEKGSFTVGILADTSIQINFSKLGYADTTLALKTKKLDTLQLGYIVMKSAAIVLKPQPVIETKPIVAVVDTNNIVEQKPISDSVLMINVQPASLPWYVKDTTPREVSCTGFVLKKGEYLTDADLTFFNNGKPFTMTQVNSTGEYTTTLKTHTIYQVKVSKGSYNETVEYNTSEVNPDIVLTRNIELGVPPKTQPKVKKDTSTIAVNEAKVVEKVANTTEEQETNGKPSKKTQPHFSSKEKGEVAIHCQGNITCKGKLMNNVFVGLFKNGLPIDSFKTNQTGHYLLNLKANEKYLLEVRNYGYYTQKVDFSTNDELHDITKDIELKEKTPLRAKGTVVIDGEPVDEVTVSLATKNEKIKDTKTNAKGEFDFNLYNDEDYKLAATKSGYFQNEIELITRNKKAGEIVTIRLSLNKLEMNVPVEIGAIYYDLGSFKLRALSFISLNKLVEFLKTNANIAIEVGSHTDARGSVDYNNELSAKRSQSIVDYLKYKGISAERIVPEAYGKSKLIIENATSEEEHQLNRRSEIKVLSMDYIKNPVKKSVKTTAIQAKTMPKTGNVPLAIVKKEAGLSPQSNDYKEVVPRDGVVYMIEVEESSTLKPAGTFDVIEQSVDGIKISYVKFEKKYLYVVCCYDYVEHALAMQNNFVKRGYDAFVIAFVNGKKVSLKDAKSKGKN